MNLKNAIPAILKPFGIVLLSKDDTVKKLMGAKLFYQGSETLNIKAATTWGDAPEDFKNAQVVENCEIGVFTIPGDKNVKFYNYGGIKIKNEVLNLDFGCSLFIKTLLRRDKRPVIETEYCIPLWSHYWGNGYFDYMFFVFTKFLRIASVLNEQQLSTVKIAYPLINTLFEKELWETIGIAPEQIIDTRKHNVKARQYIVANTQKSWYYQHKIDIELAQKIMLKVRTEDKPEYQFIYISRKGRRRLTNEDELLPVLKDLKFNFIEDKPRSVIEQMNIFSNAKVIIGPHGAAFANILWCKPGTQLIELFPKTYYPSYFRSLAGSLGLKYSAIFENGREGTHFSNMNDDLTIDPQLIKEALEATIAKL